MGNEILGACPICALSEQRAETSDHGEQMTFQCERCGPFTISRAVIKDVKDQGVQTALSAWVRDRADSDSVPPTISRETLDRIISTLPRYRVSEKQLLLLRAVERRTPYPGRAARIVPAVDFPIAWAVDEREFDYLVRALIGRGLLLRENRALDTSASVVLELVITAAGWAFIEDHARPSVISDQVFIAMSFSADLKAAWEQGIRVGLKRAGFRPYRTDAEPHLDRIDAKIISEIRNSKFLVADVTGQSHGVYFEAGYAIALGLPVFWCVRQDDLANVHFDTRQYSHIVWQTGAELAEQLYYSVTAIIGKGSTSS